MHQVLKHPDAIQSLNQSYLIVQIKDCVSIPMRADMSHPLVRTRPIGKLNEISTAEIMLAGLVGPLTMARIISCEQIILSSISSSQADNGHRSSAGD